MNQLTPAVASADRPAEEPLLPGGTPAGGNATLTLKVFAPDTPGTYTNQAIVDPGHAIPEGNETDNTDSQETIVENGGNGDFNDLSVTKTASPSPVKPNQELTYTVTVSNTEGEAPAINGAWAAAEILAIEPSNSTSGGVWSK